MTAPRLRFSILAACLMGGALSVGACTAASSERDATTDAPAVSFRHEPNVLHIAIGERSFADYVYADPQITRPFFAHVKTPAGVQVTRNYPPQPDDLNDHANMHPGVWMAFGDLSGHDYWRVKARVEHERFTSAPSGGPGQGHFGVRNYYLKTGSSDRIASEDASYTIRVVPEGFLLVWDSTFAPYGDAEQIVFGDQEEMGLGFRLQTRLAEEFGGTITDSESRTGAKQIWGKQADWLDYSGTLDGQRIGIAVMPDPSNFRRSWFHARDYGFTAANPFGREAMKAGSKSEVVVKKGDTLRLRYGLLIHSSDPQHKTDIAAAYRRFLEIIGPA